MTIMKNQVVFTSQERGLALFKRGKVRDVYKPSDEHLIIVACDRISAFDSVLATPIPNKGCILTQMSNFWFRKTEHIVANHLVDSNPDKDWYPKIDWYYPDLDGRTVLVKKTEPLAIEAIVRGYITGSGWKEYQQTGDVCGISLPGGLEESAKLPEPIFTPSTKADAGHDENISFEEAAAIVGKDIAKRLKTISIDLYNYAADYALKRGIIIADTKFEFGLLDDGELILIDEALTPDSSRFWDASTYGVGRSQESYDKQFVRDYLESIKWDKLPPAPQLPVEVVAKTVVKYKQALDRLVISQPS